MKIVKYLLFVALCFPALAAAEDLTPKQIIDKTLDQNSTGFQSGEAKLELSIKAKDGSERKRVLKIQSKNTDNKARTKVVLTAPKEVKGQAFLFVERAGDDDVWMYLPAFGVTRRIAGGQKKGAFLGSHFSYADFESRDLKDGAYKRLEDSKIGKHASYVIEATPSGKSDSDYDKIIVHVRKSDFITLKAQFFSKGKIVKTIYVDSLDKTKSGRTYAKKMTVKSALGGQTTMSVNNLKDETEISDAALSKDNLGK